MNIQDEISSIEQNRDWKSAAILADEINVNSPEEYLRIIFVLLDFVVDGQYTREEHDYAADKIINLYNKGDKLFANTPEFLFFAGIMIYIGEWYFGMNDVENGATMLKKAMTIEPQNVLYRWGYYSRIDQRPQKNTDLKLSLCKELFNQKSTLKWLKNKGLLGEYVIGTLEDNYRDLTAQKIKK